MTSLLATGAALWILGTWASAIAWYAYTRTGAIRHRLWGPVARTVALLASLGFALAGGFGFGAIVVALGDAATADPGGLWWWTRALVGVAVVVAAGIYAAIRHQEARR